MRNAEARMRAGGRDSGEREHRHGGRNDMCLTIGEIPRPGHGSIQFSEDRGRVSEYCEESVRRVGGGRAEK